MVTISDGNTDLLSKLLSSSQDAQGNPIKWKKEDDGETSVPAWKAEVKNDDGSKSIFSISLSNALATVGVNTILSEEQKKKQKERSEKTNVRDGKVIQGKPLRSKQDVELEPGESGSEKVKVEKAKDNSSDYTKSGSKIR